MLVYKEVKCDNIHEDSIDKILVIDIINDMEDGKFLPDLEYLKDIDFYMLDYEKGKKYKVEGLTFDNILEYKDEIRKDIVKLFLIDSIYMEYKSSFPTMKVLEDSCIERSKISEKLSIKEYIDRYLRDDLYYLHDLTLKDSDTGEYHRIAYDKSDDYIDTDDFIEYLASSKDNKKFSLPINIKGEKRNILEKDIFNNVYFIG